MAAFLPIEENRIFKNCLDEPSVGLKSPKVNPLRAVPRFRNLRVNDLFLSPLSVFINIDYFKLIFFKSCECVRKCVSHHSNLTASFLTNLQIENAFTAQLRRVTEALSKILEDFMTALELRAAARQQRPMLTTYLLTKRPCRGRARRGLWHASRDSRPGQLGQQ